MKEEYKALSKMLIVNFMHVTNADSVNIWIVKDNNKNSISACQIQSFCITEAVTVVGMN